MPLDTGRPLWVFHWLNLESGLGDGWFNASIIPLTTFFFLKYSTVCYWWWWYNNNNDNEKQNCWTLRNVNSENVRKILENNKNLHSAYYYRSDGYKFDMFLDQGPGYRYAKAQFIWWWWPQACRDGSQRVSKSARKGGLWPGSCVLGKNEGWRQLCPDTHWPDPTTVPKWGSVPLLRSTGHVWTKSWLYTVNIEVCSGGLQTNSVHISIHCTEPCTRCTRVPGQEMALLMGRHNS